MTLSETAPAREVTSRGWDLSELLEEPLEPSLARALGELEELVSEIEASRERLGPEIDPAALLAVWKLFERYVERRFVLSAYGSLRFAEDTQSNEALSFRNRIEHALTGFENRVLFLTLWWRSLDDEVAGRLLPDAEEEPDLAHFLSDLHRLRQYTLDERSEQIVNLKNANGIRAVMTLYSMLTNRLEFEIEIDGERRTLTRDQVTSYAFSPRAELREAAYGELLSVFEREAPLLAQVYVHRVRDWHTEYRELRGYDSAVAVRNVANDVPDRAVEVLLQSAVDNRHLFQRYFRLKAGWMGIEKLRRYDIYAPLAASERRIPYGEAVRLIRDTFESFHPEFAAKAERVFDEGHIDSEIRKGKRGGGFCATVLPSQTPWLLVNYTGKVRDAATLAHELGHAVHSMLAEDHSVLTQHASLPLAETASVFAEMLLTERLLERERDPLVRRELLAASMDDIYGTVLRQAYFVRFEIAAHEAVHAGRSSDELTELYFELLTEQFGDAVDIAPEFRNEWLAIPHIFNSPFYCYAYSFGQLLVLALYQRYREEGESFLPGYFELLAAGGSARPEELLARAGVDMTDPAFWQGGFDVVADLVAELEALDV